MAIYDVEMISKILVAFFALLEHKVHTFALTAACLDISPANVLCSASH